MRYRWDKYHPGSEEVILTYNVTTDEVDMHVKRISNPNQPYKPVGMLKVRAWCVFSGPGFQRLFMHET